MVVSLMPVDMKAVISHALVDLVKQKGMGKVTAKSQIGARKPNLHAQGSTGKERAL